MSLPTVNTTPSASSAQRWRPWALALLLCAPVGGCEMWAQPENVVIVNNSDHQIIVTAGDETVVAFQGKSIELPFPDPDALSGGKIKIETALCRLQYQLPFESDNYPWKEKANGEVALQLESDFKLYAIPPASRLPLRFTSFARLQAGDFPVAAVATRCWQTEQEK
jgi:hypothetical protein